MFRGITIIFNACNLRKRKNIMVNRYYQYKRAAEFPDNLLWWCSFSYCIIASSLSSWGWVGVTINSLWMRFELDRVSGVIRKWEIVFLVSPWLLKAYLEREIIIHILFWPKRLKKERKLHNQRTRDHSQKKHRKSKKKKNYIKIAKNSNPFAR